MQVKRAIDHIISLMREKLSDELSYHSVDHTIGVIDSTLEIAKAESCSDSEINLLIVAAAYHDSGFITGADDHEKKSCVLAKNNLPEFGFSESQIEQICGMIMATRIPQSPKTNLEEILCDADLDYLGGKRYREIADSLYQELKNRGVEITPDKWLDIQISFLSNHCYWTDYAIKKNQSNKRAVLRKLKLRLAHAQ